MAESVTTIRRRVSAKIGHMTPEKAEAKLKEIRQYGNTVYNPAIRELTGGYGGQSLNTWVTRSLAYKAWGWPK